MTMYQKRFVLALIIVLFCFIYITAITFIPGAKTSDFILGALLTTGFSTIVSFFFGSSDNKGKNDIEKSIDKQ